MNILLTTWRSLNPNIGGTENVSWNLSKELSILGYNIFFVYIQIEENSKHMCLDSFQNSNDQYYVTNVDRWCHLTNKERLSSLLRELQIDIILNQNAIYESLSEHIQESIKTANCNIKLITTHHFNPQLKRCIMDDFFFYKEQGKLNFMRERWKYNPVKWIMGIVLMLLYRVNRINKTNNYENGELRKIYQNSDAFVLLSDKFIESFKTLVEDENYNKLYVINNPVTQVEESVSVINKEKIILYVGRLVKSQKRIDRLLFIWKKLYNKHPNWKLVIVGEGHHRTALEEMVERHKLKRVEFKGHLNPKEYYKRASIFTLTSTFEGFGLVLMEAQQMGCIPMAFESYESVTDIITDEQDGFLIPPFDIDKYADKLSLLMSDEDLRVTIAQRCIDKDYSKFDIKHVVHYWINLFEEVTKR